MKTTNNAKMYTKTDNGKRSKVIEYESGDKVHIPLNKDGSVKWYKDKLKGKHK